MATTDYDAPRVVEGAETDEQYLQQLTTTRRGPQASTAIFPDRTDITGPPNYSLGLDRFDLPDEFVQAVIARQANEFACSRCFLVHHQRRYAQTVHGKPVCKDCS